MGAWPFCVATQNGGTGFLKIGFAELPRNLRKRNKLFAELVIVSCNIQNFCKNFGIISAMLKSIELSGFKSFAKRSVIDIGAPTVAVVGPNGSGKSNAAEAFRFVLGEQSIKSMRGKKREDLIWGGTDVVPRSNRASVRIVFDNSNRLLDIDFDEVVVERTVHRDGTNEYAINGSRVRLKDVTTLLAGANIGSSGHHIISQGEADRILNAGTRERREMLEDALGLKVFQYKKVESERKLLKTQENVKEIESARRELQPHLKFLAREMRKREKAEATRRELREALATYLARENTYIKSETERLSGLARRPKQELEQLEQELERQIKIKGEATGENTHENTELLSKVAELDTRADELAKHRDTLTRELGRLEGQLSFLRSEDASVKREQSVDSVPLSDVEGLISKVITETQVAENSRDAEVLRASLRSIKVRVQEFIRQVSSKHTDQDRQAHTEQIKEIEAKKINLEQELEQLTESEHTLEGLRKDAAHALERQQSKSKDAELEILELSAKRSELRSTLRDIEREEAELARAKTAFNEELREAVALLGRSARDFENVDVAVLLEQDRDAQEHDRRTIERMKIKLEEMGVVGDDVVQEYKNLRERDEFLEAELKDLETSGESLLSLIEELETELATRFKNGLEKVNEEFQNFFSILFGGGSARLDLVQQKKRKSASDLLDTGEDEEEVEEGVEVGVKLPRKRAASLEVLSGGERALTSIALIFAMSQVNPPPFIILDETDAALDEANSKRYADMVRILSEKSQLILITHNRETMAAAGELYGVTMGADGVSRLLSVKLDEAVAVAK